MFGSAGGGIRLFNFRGVPVTISVLGLFFIAWIWVFPYISINQIPLGLGIGIGVMVSIIVHELSHAAVGMAFGARVIAIQLNILGGATYFASKPKSYLKDAIISLAGPISNLVLWKILDIIVSVSRTPFGFGNARPSEIIQILAYVSSLNLLLGIFNALPGFPLDGGQAVHSFVMWLTRRDKFAAGLTMVSGLLVAGFIAVRFLIPDLVNSFSNAGGLGNYGLGGIGTIFVIYIVAWIAISSIQVFQQVNAPAKIAPTPRQVAEQQQLKSEERAKTHPGHGFFEQGRSQLMAREYEQAIAAFTQAMQLEPREISYQDYRAYTFAQMGDYGHAIADYNDLLQKNPNRADFFAARAAAFKALGNYPAARYDVEQALKINPTENQAMQLRYELDKIMQS